MLGVFSARKLSMYTPLVKQGHMTCYHNCCLSQRCFVPRQDLSALSACVNCANTANSLGVHTSSCMLLEWHPLGPLGRGHRKACHRNLNPVDKSPLTVAGGHDIKIDFNLGYQVVGSTSFVVLLSMAFDASVSPLHLPGPVVSFALALASLFALILLAFAVADTCDTS